MFKTILFSLLAAAALAVPLRAAAADLKSDLAKLQGQWKGKVTGDESGHGWTMDIKGNKSTLTIRNSDGDEVVKAECDFKLEQHGKFRAFTYSNLKHLKGDKSGDTELTDGKSKSSLYRLDGDSTLVTVGGFREDVEEDPQWLIKWEMVK